MYQLLVAEYPLVNDLLADIPFNINFARSVVDDKVAGLILVDDRENPTVVYIRHDYGMSLLCGATYNAEFNAQLFNFLGMRNGFLHTEHLQVYPDAWHGVLLHKYGNSLVKEDQANLAKDTSIIEHTRVNFKLNIQLFHANLIKINLAQHDVREFTDSQFDDFNGVVVPKYFWRDRKLFNEYAKAFAVYIDEQIASVAFAAFCDDEILELGIETVEKFRGKGLAAVACTKLIEYALSQHLEPLWSCRQSNLGSYKLAEQLGFKVSCKLPYYQIHQ